MKKLTLLAGIAAGYVLGTRAGRERYEQIRSGARRIAQNPKVQSASKQAKDTVAEQAPVVRDAVKEKVTSAASTAADKVRGNDGGAHSATASWPTDTAAPPAS